jgi:Transposase IS66 family
MTRDELEAGRGCGRAKTAATCAELLNLEPALWTFARVEGVEPKNNAAERALRHAVQWRRASYGTDSEAGGRFPGNILSAVATCRQQGRNVLEFLTACCEAARHGSDPPRRKRLMESSFAQTTGTGIVCSNTSARDVLSDSLTDYTMNFRNLRAALLRAARLRPSRLVVAVFVAAVAAGRTPAHDFLPPRSVKVLPVFFVPRGEAPPTARNPPS